MKEKFSFSQFQKLGKVLMTPVMIMPIAGILVGVGSAFTTKNIVELMPFLGTIYVKLFFNLCYNSRQMDIRKKHIFPALKYKGTKP